jgi:lysophospholipase L1-like esterase
MAATPRKIAIALAALTVAAIAAEAGLRRYHPIGFRSPAKPPLRGDPAWGNLLHRPASLPGLVYELVPNFEGRSQGMSIRTNSRGMRGPEPLPADTPNLVRIAVVGDSFAFGFGLDEEHIFPRLLQHDLQGSELGEDRTIDVLDLGVSGYSTRDEVLALKKYLDLRPDLVLVAYCLNDPECEPIQQLPRFFTEPEWWQHSHVLRAVAKRLQAREVARSGGVYTRFLHEPNGWRWRTVCDAFAELRELGREHGFRVAVVIFPMTEIAPWDRYRYRDVHEQVAREAERNGFPVLDLLGPYSEHEPAELVLSPDDRHPNVLGHRLAAEAIEAFLSEHPELLGRR